MALCIETKYFIVNLMQVANKSSLPVSQILKFMGYLYKELSFLDKIKDYRISYDINRYSLIRTVQYNRDIFDMSIDEENIYLLSNVSYDKLAEKYKVDDTIKKIIIGFFESRITNMCKLCKCCHRYYSGCCDGRESKEGEIIKGSSSCPIYIPICNDSDCNCDRLLYDKIQKLQKELEL